MTAILYTTSAILIFANLISTAAGKDEPFLGQGFAFDYTPTAAPVPVPTTTQCESIPLNWGPGAFNGPSPVAPYYIQVYTSTFLFPMVIDVGSGRNFDWPVPYIPGTQYQICMFASNGVTGGCQRMYTVIPAANTTLENPPVCQNLTYPAANLNVQPLDHTGDLSQYAWVDQCTDISLKPLNGTPPFTMTVASTLHPPWNLTSNDMSPINWTVQLSWGSPFFISLVDSQGLSWAYGPLHSGGNGPTDCLSSSTSPSPTQKGISGTVVAGSGIGGLIAGALAGALIAWLILKRRINREHDGNYEDRIHPTYYKSEGLDSPGGLGADNYAAVPVTTNSPRESEAELLTVQRSHSSRGPFVPGSGYEVEPFQLPGDPALSDIASTQHHSSNSSGSKDVASFGSGRRTSRTSRGPRPPPGSVASSSSNPQSPTTSAAPHVYVVHHDGGRAPVSVYTPQGTEVIELPPRYEGGTPGPHERPPLSFNNSSSSSAGPLPRKLPSSPAGRSSDSQE